MGILATQFALTDRMRLRNRLVATAHARGDVRDGLPTRADAEYWARLAAGGVAMCIAGGTATAPESTYRLGNLTEAWRAEAVPGLRQRSEAIHKGGASAVLQLVHLGRETLGAEGYYAPVAPSAVRSPREPNRPRALTDGGLNGVVEAFRVSAANAAEAEFDGIELHAAHGYLLGQLLSPVVNQRPDAGTAAGRSAPVLRVLRAVREAAPACAVGIRLGVGDPADAGLSMEQLAETISLIEHEVDYLNLTAGMRSDYVRDMANPGPVLIEHIAQLRALTRRPLVISHGFRDLDAIEQALEGGADLVGIARALIADPDLPRKALAGRAAAIRPCVACNEDCRSFTPSLLCTVNPELAAPGDLRRRAAPLVRRALPHASRRVAIVGAGVGGLEAALTLQRAGVEVVLFEKAGAIGGAIRTASSAPNRGGWLRLVEFYERNLDSAWVEQRLGQVATPGDVADVDSVVLAVGSEETLPEGHVGARTTSDALHGGPGWLSGATHLVVVDDGFSWWPHVNAVELGVAAGVPEITLITPGTGFAGAIPPESLTSLLKRLAGNVRLHVRPLMRTVSVDKGRVELQPISAGQAESLYADAVIVVGERRVRDWSAFEVDGGGGLVVIGDAVTPRRVAHAIAEGRAAAERLQGS